MSSADLTTKVLATENIHIVRKNVRTAAFDLINRTLILPTWKDMTPEAESMLSLHEISHALFTPTRYVDEIKANRDIRSYLNVLEDVRCEKLFQEHYPGSRRDFIAGYKSVNEKDFFGLSKVNVADLNLIDRINIFFKIGLTAGVKFKRYEQTFIDKIPKMVTFQDVVDLANEIYAQEKQRNEQEKEDFVVSNIDDHDEFDELDDEEFDELDDEEFGNAENETESDYNTDVNAENETESDYNTDVNAENETESDYNTDVNAENETELVKELDSLTQKEFDDNLESVSDPDYNPLYGTFRPLTENYIFDYDQVLDVLRYNRCQERDYVVEKFKRQSNKQISHIVQQFELKKAANIYSRQRISKSGNLDINKISTYKFNSDIFRRTVKTPIGQNHGMIMLLDWSGSMKHDDKIQLSLRQSIQLAMFCRKTNIPFRVYAFTSVSGSKSVVRLNEFFSNEMTKKKFNEMISRLLSPNNYHVIPLGSTPLAPALRVLLDIIPKFKSENHLDKVSLISFTDGENTCALSDNSQWTEFQLQDGETRSGRDIFIMDTDTKKNYKFSNRFRVYGNLTRECTSLYEMMKDRYNINIISFVVATTSEIGSAYSYLDTGVYPSYDKKTKFTRDKFISLDAPGRDIAFVVSPKMLQMEEMDTNNISDNMTAGQISRSLLKTTKKSLKNKVLLNEFINIIA